MILDLCIAFHIIVDFMGFLFYFLLDYCTEMKKKKHFFAFFHNHRLISILVSVQDQEQKKINNNSEEWNGKKKKITIWRFTFDVEKRFAETYKNFNYLDAFHRLLFCSLLFSGSGNGNGNSSGDNCLRQQKIPLYFGNKCKKRKMKHSNLFLLSVRWVGVGESVSESDSDSESERLSYLFWLSISVWCTVHTYVYMVYDHSTRHETKWRI